MSSLCANQIVGSEKKLEELARSVARPGMMALEVGSWAGASSSIIGKVVQENKGHLYCVDWWKGNVTVPSMLSQAAETVVFQLFWDTIKRAGLDGCVHPMRMKSEVAALILGKCIFDFVFIDAEHSYQGVLADLKAFYPTVKADGLFCGHDCEVKLKDADPDIIEAHKDEDWYAPLNMHCGVIKAVGEMFPNHELKDRIWYVRNRVLL